MKKTLLVLALSFGFTSPVIADFNTALDAYQAGNFESAYAQFYDMASIGEKRSQFNLGVMYYQGQHVPKNLNKAYAWLKLSTDSETMQTNHLKALEAVEKEITNKAVAEEEYKSIAKKFSTDTLLDSLYPELVEVEKGFAFEATPIKMKSPKYPRKAALTGVQGWTRFTFDLDKKGAPRNIQLLESVPQGVFDLASIRAIKKWKFEPAQDNAGQPILQQNLKYTMQYRLKGAGPLKLKDGLYETELALAEKGDASAQLKIGFWEKKLNISKGKQNPNAWYLKAALQGQPEAQYQLGQSLVFGQGCLLDKSKGIEWLTRAANSGQKEARLLLASTESRIKTIESHRRSVEYTKGLKQLPSSALIDQAWMLATSPFKEIANPKKALKLLGDVSSKTFEDDITLYEIKAAAYAALGDFNEAVDQQEEALEEAEDRDADTDLIMNRLASYKKNKRWF